MLKHYLDLLSHFRKVVLIGAVGTGALACVLSILLLEVMPLYKSSVTLNMEPSDEALSFNRAFMGVTQFSPASIITQTHIERLLSRPVAERALDILISEAGGDLPVDPPTVLDKVKTALWQTWNVLNYGYFSPPLERDQWLNDLMSATDVTMVEGSYILYLEIIYDQPEMAARAANALARAYIETASQQFAADAAAVDAAIARLQADKNAELASGRETRRALERQLGFNSVDEGRAVLISGRVEAAKAVNDAERQIRQLREKLEAVGATEDEAVALLADLPQAVELAERRVGTLNRANAALAALEETDAALAAVDLRIREIETDLATLQDRRQKTSLAREARMQQVRIISEALVPVYPFFPKVLLNTMVGTILGAILALAPIAMLDVLDDRVRTAADLRQIVGSRTLPSVSRGLGARARDFLRGSATPGRQLVQFADVMARRLAVEMPGRARGRRIYVTALGSAEQMARLQAVVDAALRQTEPLPVEGAPQTEVVALPAFGRIADWGRDGDGAVIVGLASGSADRLEVEGMAAAIAGPNSPPFFAVLL